MYFYLTVAKLHIVLFPRAVKNSGERDGGCPERGSAPEVFTLPKILQLMKQVLYIKLVRPSCIFIDKLCKMILAKWPPGPSIAG